MTTSETDNAGGTPVELVVDASAGLELDLSTLPSALPLPTVGTTDAMPLDTVLSEALFGEVIDISDLIPQFWSNEGHEGTAPATSPESLASATDLSWENSADLAIPHDHAVLNILYDDGDLTGGNAL